MRIGMTSYSDNEETAMLRLPTKGLNGYHKTECKTKQDTI
jgi:hypothetical protein